MPIPIKEYSGSNQTVNIFKKINALNLQNSDSFNLFKQNYSSEYSLIVLFSTLGACLLVSSSDLVFIYVDPATKQTFTNAYRITSGSSTGQGGNVGVVDVSAGNVGVIDVSGESGATTNSMIGGNLDLEDLFYTLLRYISDFFSPVPVDFSNDVLLNQLHNISIILFMITVVTIILFIYLLINIILYIFSEKLINYFTNTYIKMYLSLNKRIIVFEICAVSL